jgi:uncharacterized protein (DUF1800 family)
MESLPRRTSGLPAASSCPTPTPMLPPAPQDVFARPASGALPAGLGVGMAGAALGLTACGGGGEGVTAPVPAPPPPPPAPAPTEAEASRFLAQASLGASRAQIASVVTLGFAGWLDAQFNLPASTTRWDMLVADGYTDISNRNGQAGFDSVAWRKLLSSPDTLRQRVTLALSEIMVVAVPGLAKANWKQFSGAAYLDLLEMHAFGRHRDLLQAIARSYAMGAYLTFLDSTKANANSGALPDENFAREVMQLFTIGLVQLNLDGTPQRVNGNTVDSYGLNDITGLARVFTGWQADFAGGDRGTPDYVRRPLVNNASAYETGAKSFLGTTIAANTPANTCLTTAMDTIAAHANVAPFFCRQLIQRLVTSNPSPAYVARMAAVFNNDGSGVRGNLRAVVRALLLDEEARSATTAAAPTWGKLREPMLRFIGWGRAFSVSSPSGKWAVGDTSDPASKLAQSPLRSPSVFNFFRPGYVPPDSELGQNALVAPEFQLENESSVLGCINYLQQAVAGYVGDLTPDYSSLLALADNANSLLDELNLVLAANQLSSATRNALASAVATMPSGTSNARLARIGAALVLVLSAPEYIVQK